MRKDAEQLFRRAFDPLPSLAASPAAIDGQDVILTLKMTDRRQINVKMTY